MKFNIVRRIAIAIPPATEEELLLESSTVFSRCYMYDVNYTELLAQGVRHSNLSWPRVRCKKGWTFNHTMVPYASIAAEVINDKMLRRYHFTCVNFFCIAEVVRLINCHSQQNDNINKYARISFFFFCLLFLIS